MKAELLKEKQFVFIIGAARSGTTLLFRALSAHPNISSAGHEVNVFNSYVAPLVKIFEKESGQPEKKVGKVGLPLLLDREKMDEFILQLIENIYQCFTILPQHKIIVDKSPIYSYHVDLIKRYIPGAKFIHIIRDGRDVAYSWNKTWSKGFGNPDFKNACIDWLLLKNGARKASKFKDDYYELHYEDFLKDPMKELTSLFTFCNLNATPEVVQPIVLNSTGEKNMVSVPDTSVSFSDRVSGKPLWKIRLSKTQQYIAKKYLAKDLIQEGYEKDSNWGLTPMENMMYAINFFTLARYSEVSKATRKVFRKLKIIPA